MLLYLSSARSNHSLIYSCYYLCLNYTRPYTNFGIMWKLTYSSICCHVNILPHVSETKPCPKRKLVEGLFQHHEQTEGFSHSVSRIVMEHFHLLNTSNMVNTYKILVRIWGKRPFGRSRYGLEDKIRMDLRGIGYEGVDWIHMAQDRASGGLLWTE